MACVAKYRTSVAAILVMVSVTVFNDIFSYGVIVPILPYSLRARAAVQEHDLQFWTSMSLASYAAAIAVSAPVWSAFGIVAARRRTLMLLGMIILTGASLILFFMKNVAMLIVGRVMQGLASALTWTIGLSIVVHTVNENRFGQAMGWITLGSTLGLTLSPLLSGVIYNAGGYSAVWIMCFAMLAVDITIRVFVTEENQTINKHTASKAAELGASSSSPKNLSFTQVRLMFTNINLPIALALTAVESCILTAFDCTLPIFVQSTFKWGALATGLSFMPLALPSFLGPLIGRWCDRWGPKWLLSCGFASMALFIMSLRWVDDNTVADKVLLVCLLTGVGIGSACVFGPVTAEVLHAMKEIFPSPDDRPIALAYAFYNISFSIGAVAGPMLSGFLLSTAGWKLSTLSVASVATAAAVLCAVAVKRSRN